MFPGTHVLHAKTGEIIQIINVNRFTNRLQSTRSWLDQYRIIHELILNDDIIPDELTVTANTLDGRTVHYEVEWYVYTPNHEEPYMHINISEKD